MKSLKFVNKDRSQFTATLRKNVNAYFKERNLSQKGNWKMIVKAGIMLTLYIAPFVLMLTVSFPGWAIFPLAVAMGIGMAGTGMNVMHDAVHGTSSSRSWINRLLGRSMYAMGSHVMTWKIQHNVMHHTFTNIEGYDEDIEPRGVLRLSQHSPLKKIHRYQHLYAFFFYSLMTISKMVKEFFQLYQYNKAGITAQQNASPRWEYAKLIISKSLYLFAMFGLPLIFSSFTWWEILLGFLIVHATAALIMSIIFQMAHIVEGVEQPLPNEEGQLENEWAIHQLQTTANFARNNRLLGWLIGGLNFQIEHHLFPNICHIHYRKISHIVEQTALEFGLAYNLKPSFIGAVGSHLRTLRDLGRG